MIKKIHYQKSNTFFNSSQESKILTQFERSVEKIND